MELEIPAHADSHHFEDCAVADAKMETPRWINGVEPPAHLLQADGSQILELECRQQPQRLLDAIHAYRSDPELRSQLQTFGRLSHRPGPVMFVGMGASYCSSFSASVVLTTHGRLSFSADAGEWLHYAQPVWNDAAFSVLLTTSGESAELIELMKAGEERALGLICNNPASTCWNMAQNRLPILAGPEYGNATKTYTNSTAVAIILASEMLGRPWEDDAKRAAEVYSAALDPIFRQRGELEAFCREAANIEVVGRGSAYGAAIMSALCIREMSGHRAAAHTGAGFKHGPNLDVDGSHLAIIFALGRVASLGIKLAEECNRRGGKVVLISNSEHPRTEKLFPVRLDTVPEPWESITALLVPQALTLGMVERTGCRLPPRFQYGVMTE
jgi:glucosamine--fructose-6-phosphate aminotransferase (isomerizing)